MSDYFNLPADVLDAKRWLVWRLEPNADPSKKPRKVPYYANGKKRGATDTPQDHAQLVSFDAALAALQRGNSDGLGFALGADGTGNHWQGIDLDNVADHPELAEIIEDLPGYTEKSPSGNGWHAMGYGKPFQSMGSNDTGIEAYAAGRYFTVTADESGIQPPCCLADFVEQRLRPLHQRGKVNTASNQAVEQSTGEVLTPEQITDLRSALNIFDANHEEAWAFNAKRLKNLGAIGKGLWLDWSQLSLEKFDPVEAEKKWRETKVDRTGYAAVFAEAQKLGWVNPRSKAATVIDDSPRTWPEPADPFADYPVPSFPMGTLPEVMRDYCAEKSAQSGFDIGGYAFSLLIAASNAIDHRSRHDVGPFKTPSYLWGGLVGASGGGKSPILNDGARALRAIDGEIVKQSQAAMALWKKQAATAKAAKVDAPDRPAWRQRIANDTTTEALADLLVDNPEGVVLIVDELSEFIGRMDAYAGGSGGKDRGVYLRSFDGGMVTINRASRPVPMVVDNFSVGILTGIQPEKLAEMFKKSGGGADGLYQRFLPYCLRAAGKADYSAELSPFTETNLENIFSWLYQQKPLTVGLAADGRKLMQDYHNHMRTIASRTPGSRLAEHLDKYPGFLARIALTLHCIESHGNAAPHQVALETLERARQILAVMYRHSEAVYAVLDSSSGDVMRLVRSAAEAMLTKGWASFMRGDLTRNATHWQGCEQHASEAAIDHLIELGWIADVTAARLGRRGRKSDGAFIVNPAVLQQFQHHADRVRNTRQERYSAIQQAVGNKLD